MRYVEIEGLRLSRLGLGTWQFGSREWGYGDEYARTVAPALVRRAVELGITMIDTAEVYGFGRSERIIGEVLATLDPATRRGLTVATKFMPVAPLEPVVAWQADGSRERLGVRSLDLYYAHWPNPFVSPGRVMQSLRPIREAQVARHIAVSNHSLAQWQRADRALGAPVIANQVRFSLLAPEPAEALVPWAAAHGRLVVAYSPLGQGLLSGRTDFSDASAPRRRGVLAPSRGRSAPSVDELRDVVSEIAAGHGATPAQVSLAWVLGHPNTIAIPGARTIQQLEENAAAADLVLSPAEMHLLTGLANGSIARLTAR